MTAAKKLSVLATVTASLPLVASAQHKEEVLYSNPGPVQAGSGAFAELHDTYDETDDPYDGVGNPVWTYDTEVADDFLVPEGANWSLERVFIEGRYQGVPAFDPKLTFQIWSNSASNLPDQPLADPNCSASAVTPTITAPYDLSYKLPTACVLPPGRYWFMVTVDTAPGGKFFVDVVKRSTAPGDLQLALRTNCGYKTTEITASNGINGPFHYLPFGNCNIFYGGTLPQDYPNVTLGFSLYGDNGVDEPVPDAGTPDGGTETDGGTDGGVADAGTHTDGGVDAGHHVDSGTPDGGEPVADAGEDAGEDGGEVGGGGCDCSTTGNSMGNGLGTLSLTALALWLTRRRRKSAPAKPDQKV
ncbi:MAG: MYXO-CTERM sorting domain-containing protein [Myxococcales bacterium]